MYRAIEDKYPPVSMEFPLLATAFSHQVLDTKTESLSPRNVHSKLECNIIFILFRREREPEKSDICQRSHRGTKIQIQHFWP